MSAGLSEAHGPAVDPSAMQSAAAAAMWGLAMLVPDITVVPPPMAVEVMHVPGAAIVCACPALVAAKFEKLA